MMKLSVYWTVLLLIYSSLSSHQNYGRRAATSEGDQKGVNDNLTFARKLVNAILLSYSEDFCSILTFLVHQPIQRKTIQANTIKGSGYSYNYK